ncbi:glia maturation factor gamma isoform X12 [Hippocampus zosterae]|uniref:glia maturation factor gamma isoform X6 n=1 Tax=Hippocampus zosterae TaxID=109293 RepID=UPI00223DACDC|nr:glia maturation factor gamma isoform X6 [Hippocampus zosterae]XP_051933535.1 glia maturation factor gamma isoform X7 [Hippocampus zosterae]XP_051933540.1 glia maturation factor gamma isoform X11 [Hippocampus zosterae]XP_051933541.1 glia maturation factor gamma isoform X12 [Hippocampus zosterae]
MAMMGIQMDDDLEQKLKRLTNHKHALIMKMENKLLILDQEHENISMDDLRNKIPENEPRIIAYTYDFLRPSDSKLHHSALILVNPDPSPGGCSAKTVMVYVSSVELPKKAMNATQYLEIKNKNDLTEQWLKNHLVY